jgi:hypothetical protein
MEDVREPRDTQRSKFLPRKRRPVKGLSIVVTPHFESSPDDCFNRNEANV